jgi:hypothetical protein
MFIHPDGSYESGYWQTAELYPNSQFIDEKTPIGQALANKIVSLYPFYTPVYENGVIVDAIPRTPTPEEEEALKPPKTADQLRIEQLEKANEQLMLDNEQTMIAMADIYEQLIALQGGAA